MIVNRQVGVIQRRGSYNGQLTQQQPPCKNSIEWKNRKLALNTSAQQILSRNSINEKFLQQDDYSDIENTNNINLTQNSNRNLDTQINDNGITLNGSTKLFINNKNGQTSLTQEGKDGEISFSKNEDLSEQPSMNKEIGSMQNINTLTNQIRGTKRSFIGDDQKIDLYSNVQNSYNWEQQQQGHSVERPNHQKTYSNHYEQMLSDLKTDEDIQISNNTSAAIINNVYLNQQHQTNNNNNNNSNNNNKYNSSQSDFFNERKSINNLFENINITNGNLQLPSRRSTQSLHLQNQNDQINLQKNHFKKIEDNQEIEENTNQIDQIDDYFKKKPQGIPPIYGNGVRQRDNQNQLPQQQQQQQHQYQQVQQILNQGKQEQKEQINKEMQQQYQQQNQQQQQQQQQQNTYATSIVNYYNATTTEEQFDYNEDDTAPLPSTFRKILNENGIKYNAAEYDRLIKLIPNESEINKLKYYFLPLKIQEQEKIIEKSNQNILQLQESIQILLKREQSSRQEYLDYQSQVQIEMNQLQERQKHLTKDLMEKENMIASIQIQLESKNNEIQSLQLKLQKQRLEFSNFEQTKAEIEFSIKEKEMKIEMIMKENEEIKKENKIIREEKLSLLDQVTDLERNIQVRDNKAAKLIIDRKNQNDDYSIRQNVLIQENQQLREQINIFSGQNKKLMKSLQEYKLELANLKQNVFDIASNIPCFKNIQLEQFQENSQQEQIPTSLVNQYVELLKQQLQHLKSVEEIQNKKGNNQKIDGVFIPNKEQNKFEGNVSTFRRQELD